MRVTPLRPRSPALAPFISSMGYLEGEFPHGRERVLPSGTVQLLVNLDRDALHSAPDGLPPIRTGGAALQGPSARPALVDTADQRAILWVEFRPGGAAPFFPGPAEACDQLVPLDAVWGRRGPALRERLLAAGSPEEMRAAVEAALLAAAEPPRPDPALTAAVAALHRGATVADTADRLGWTTKRLARLFSAHVGLAPKRFARIRRFQRLLSAAAARGEGDWARLAAECGYHDQAHMIHDFRAFAGQSPTEYSPRSAEERNHVPFLQGDDGTAAA
ncbi:helix-turn-helix domain-containing protein [Phytohabitans kaempferiae]|uniref:Helix-turn-helix domain-containing protein n=1 Tax=Phytohabitans kaempferiae TaxID=1620943 RepID=A0ABV6LZM2_9ACTN